MHGPQQNKSPIIHARMQLQRSQTADIPRRKIYLSHLGQLLHRHVEQPETEVANKLFPESKKQSDQHHRSKSNKILPFRKTTAELPITKDALANYQSVQLPQTSVKDRPKRSSLEDLRPKSTIIDTRRSSFQGSVFTFKAKITPFQHFSSVQLNKTPQQQQKTFLRKGSNLHKQIVTSLLRNSSSRRGELESRRYSKGEIAKMVNIFKGAPEPNKTATGKQVLVSFSKTQKGSIRGMDAFKDIKGWEDDSFDHDTPKD